jgi:hypothetical protein
VSTVLFYVSFVCKCILYYCHWVATKLQLNIYIISYAATLNYNNETFQNFNMVFYVLTCCIQFSLNGPILSKLNKEEDVFLNVWWSENTESDAYGQMISPYASCSCNSTITQNEE